jgi:hypothetical protein
MFPLEKLTLVTKSGHPPSKVCRLYGGFLQGLFILVQHVLDAGRVKPTGRLFPRDIWAPCTRSHHHNHCAVVVFYYRKQNTKCSRKFVLESKNGQAQ